MFRTKHILNSTFAQAIRKVQTYIRLSLISLKDPVNSIQFNSIYLFAIENYMNRSKKKKAKKLFSLSWRGSPKEASGLIENGLPQINN